MGNGTDAKIDTLRIDIETRITSDTDKIDKIYESLKRLKSITEEKWSGLDEVVSKINKLGSINQTAFAGFNQSLQTAASNISNLQQTATTPIKTDQSALLNEIDAVKKRYEDLSAVLNFTGGNVNTLTETQQKMFFAMASNADLVTKYQTQQANSAKILNELYSELNKTTSTLANVETPKLKTETTKLGKSAETASLGWGKLIQHIKNIAFYRVVRRVIQLIGKEIANSIKNVVLFDDQTNEAISRLMTSWKTFGNSLGIVFSQLIISIEPLLTRLLDAGTSVANALSLVFAKLSGEETYMKAIKNEVNYREELEKTNKQLLGFDRFNVLQQAPDASNLFVYEEVTKGLEEASKSSLLLIDIFEKLNALFKDIIKYVKQVWETVSPHIPAIVDGATKIWQGIKKILDVLIPVALKIMEIFVAILKFLDKAGLLEGAIYAIATAIFIVKGNILGVILLVGGLLKLMDDAPRPIRIIVGALAMLVGAIMAATIAWMAFHGTMTMGVAVPIILTAVGVGIAGLMSMIGGIGDFKYFADGGVPDTRGGSVAIWNEKGNPELIHENNRGQVEISNQQSIEGAMLNALRQHDMETQGRGQTIDVNVGFDVNGNALARSLNPYLKQETIRIGNR